MALIGILIILVICGVCGYTIISGIMQRRLRDAEGAAGQAQLEVLRTDYAQLEGRLGQLEEEVAFLRALRAPEPLPELPESSES